ncbi:MAG TPA: cyclase family protein [Candidatus Babeliales bacterium]|nr:cyclase family protein [Candidatus Babeliales bacterium]
MKYIDISWPISQAMTTYKDRKNVSIIETKTWNNDQVRETSLSMGLHTGTHIDAPSHMLEQGDTISSDAIVMQRCQVLDLTNLAGGITKDDLMQQDITESIILLKTNNSSLDATAPFDPNFVYLEQSGAEYLIEQGVTLVGIDYLGIERNQPGHPTHKVLLEKGVVNLEGLRLKHVDAGTYNLICLPLSISNVDAAPARAVLVK